MTNVVILREQQNDLMLHSILEVPELAHERIVVRHNGFVAAVEVHVEFAGLVETGVRNVQEAFVGQLGLRGVE